MRTENISIRELERKDAEFLFNLMNNASILDALNEVASLLEFWESAIAEWTNDADEEDYIILDAHAPVGWLGVNHLAHQTSKLG